MSRTSLCLVLLLASIAAGCAGHRDTLATAPADAASATAAAPAGGTSPPTVVDGNQLAQRAAGTILCREIQGVTSNVPVRRCMTAENWKTYEQREAQRAQETVRAFQRGRY